MGFNSIKGSIEEFFQYNWNSYTPIEFDNVKLQRKQNESWVKLVVVNGESFQNGFSGGGVYQYRTPGILNLSIFIPIGGGTSEGDLLADRAVSFLRGAHYEGITFYTPSLIPIGEIGDWYQMALTTPFTIDEIV